MRKLILSITLSLCSLVYIAGQEKHRDSLFFNLDGKYIYESKYAPNVYILIDSKDIDEGTFFFEKTATFNDLNSKQVLCLKKYIRSSKFYNKKKKRKLDDDGLLEHFEKYIIFLVKKDKNASSYIKVKASWEIE